MAKNLVSHGHDRVKVIPDPRPVFRFVNGQRKECVSSVQLQVDVAADKTGRMDLHSHDTPDQPVLVSVRAL